MTGLDASTCRLQRFSVYSVSLAKISQAPINRKPKVWELSGGACRSSSMGDVSALRVRRVPQLIFFGDSLTHAGGKADGWCQHIAARFSGAADVVVRGFPGYNTRHATHILPHLCAGWSRASEHHLDSHPLAQTPDVVTLFWGANDAATEGEQRVPLGAYEQNLLKMCAYLRSVQSPGLKLILVTPPWVDQEMWDSFCKAEHACPSGLRRASNTAAYAAACTNAANLAGAACLDLFSIFESHPNRSELLSDGLHMTAMGQRLLAEKWFECVKENYSELVERLSTCTLYPSWRDLDSAHLEKSLDHLLL
ncbi:Isoamyl acetate-hydrolyzing esterase 1-like [Porphyridium purpureum]|uniref:Isoamyl acetate-hydrolyzing esterase 1-like n=1 Tax=Porphyridium purpureum TaxID=35688 RepID=A0A5J4Z870_PORPP|nr:Isoamyl acetate-hydrolyzing esterase 1-like [Porphyridium purpureum]|eukprot:POR3315..scf295_1